LSVPAETQEQRFRREFNDMNEDKNLYTVFFKKNKAEFNENIILFVNGFIEDREYKLGWTGTVYCVLILTNKGVRLYSTGLGKEFFIKFSVSEMKNIEYCSYFLRDGVKITVNDKVIDFRIREKRKLARVMYEALKDAHAVHQMKISSSASSEATKKSDVETSLDTLARLRDAGYITQAEFKEKRESILSGLGKPPKPDAVQSAEIPPLVPSASNGYLRPDEVRKPRVWVYSP